MRQLHVSFAGVLAIVLLAAPSSAVLAEVTVFRVIKTGDVGAPEIHEIDYFKGTLKRTDSKMKLTGKVFGMWLRPKDLSTIYRVDRDLIWEINRTKKTYIERPISLSQGDEEAAPKQGEGAAKADKPAGERQAEVRVVRSEFEIQKTGAKNIINGFDCRRYVLTWLIETENVKTGDRKKSIMTGDFWNTLEDGNVKDLMAAEDSFNRAYLEKLGLDMTPDDMKRFGLEVLGGLLWAEGMDLKKEMTKMEGYPIVTSIAWVKEGDREAKVEREGEGSVQLPKGGNFQTIFQFHTEIKEIETSPFPESHFEVPKEYKKEKSTL
jgi:hypothetical protein